MEIKLLSGALGAEIKGIDLTDTSNENFKIINDLLLEHKVIFFRDQPITKDQQIALAEKFGPLETHAYVKGLEKYPEIATQLEKKWNVWAKENNVLPLDARGWSKKIKSDINNLKK